jgi:ABC-type dipeptide/oligopeptide/nickel transport system ATPase component
MKQNSIINQEKTPIVYIDETISRIGCSIIEQDNRYIKIKANGDKITLSNFIIVPIEMVQMDNEAQFKVEFHTISNKLITKILYTSDFTSTSKFKSALNRNSIDLIYQGNDHDLEIIKDIISKKPYAVKTGVNFVGMFKKASQYVFVSDTKSIDKNDSIVDDVVIMETAKCISTELTEVQPIDSFGLAQLSKFLFKFNILPITATIIGFSASCFLKEKLWQSGRIKHNYLIITGESGSGKSETVENVIMPIFAATNCTISSGQITRFVNARMSSSSNLIPMIITEYKPTKLNKNRMDEISDLLRNAYDRTPAYRGRPDLILNEYLPLAPIILVGEMGFDETAIKERSLEVLFSKANIRDEVIQGRFKLLKHRKRELRMLGRSLLNQALKIEPDELIRRHRAIENRINLSLPSRVKNSIANCMQGLLLLKDVYDSLNMNFEKQIGYSIQELFNSVLSGVYDYLLDGQNEAKGSIEKVLEVICRMEESGVLIRGNDYQVINQGTELALNISPLYDKFTKYVREHNILDVEVLSLPQFRKQLRTKEYFNDYKTVRFNTANSADKPVKAYTLDIAKLREILDISALVE